jgi:oxygen-independent coproporphyrinogen III oxidase
MPSHLYLHMPYCRRRCPYCDFFKVVPKAGERELFINTLSSEINLAAQQFKWPEGPAATVYFGGGTPSLHPYWEIHALLGQIHTKWAISDATEITLEANPGMINLDQLAGFRRAGINRLSCGGQSFSPRKLGLLYRDHTVHDIYTAVETARLAAFENLSLDLIFGLPDETREEWESDIRSALALRPEHISLYNLEYHENTPFYKWRANGRMMPLSDDREAEMYLLAHELMTAEGYEHYEVSNFARPGFRSRHNSACWEGKAYLGLGPSAHSYDGQRLRFHNAADMPAYFSTVQRGELPIVNRVILSDQERREEYLSLALRRREGLAYNDAIKHFGDVRTLKLWERAEELPAELRTFSDQQFALTASGWFRENSILLWLFAAFDSDLH